MCLYSLDMAYIHPLYHGGKNFPEQITDEFLTCTICRVPGFRKPKMLTCGHTFCAPCIERYLGLGEGDGGGFYFACPTCKQPQKLPRGGVASLTNNLFADTQIDRLLRRHNMDRRRDDTLYNIEKYTQDVDTLHASFPVPGQKIYKDLPY